MTYFCSLIALIGIYSILTLSTNLLIGYGGIVSMAQAGVFGIGAYCVAILTLHGVNFWLAILPAIALCVLANILMTLPSVRAGGLYFMVVSFGFCKLMNAVFSNWTSVTGGSYGGFMANWMVGHTDRFAAVASQRSISNFISKCLTTDIGYYDNLSAVQSDPWNSPEEMWNRSPLKYADKCKTPTLFIQSDEDYRCWMADALQMFTALRMHGVPTRVCLFHGENHELSRSGKPKHRVRRLKEITNWFDHYLKHK